MGIEPYGKCDGWKVIGQKSANAASEEPSSLIASMAFSLATASLSLSSFPSSVSITSLTWASTSSAMTNSLYPSISTAILISSTMNTLFMLCSAYSGQHIIGSPDMMASSVEFQPQCVTNAATALCCSTSDCGAQFLSTMPLLLVLSKNPAGSSRSKSGSGNWLCSSSGLRTAHRKRWPEVSKPRAISCSCEAEKAPLLPKQRNTTLLLGCASSHARHSCGLSSVPLSP
ncbi:hypothetical protein U9M48_040000 [Paspalum notatum var. saurae]|uniref:Uncharacterized protein n=1 Tax=Paspalum notatum var. saurae TaxID=547442 RepID=A0AAQ3UMG6_PASNO